MSSPTAFSGRKGSLLFWGVGLLAIVIGFALDGPVDGRIYRPVHDATWNLATALSKYGDWPPVILGGLVVAVGLMLGRQAATGRLLLGILLAGMLTGLGSDAVRAIVGRTRPLAQAPQGFYGMRYEGRWIAGKYEFSSFPSGHTALWAGLAGAAWFRRRGWALAFLAVGAAVAWSRIALGCHHFSDVTASMVWGLGVGSWAQGRLSKFPCLRAEA